MPFLCAIPHLDHVVSTLMIGWHSSLQSYLGVGQGPALDGASQPIADDDPFAEEAGSLAGDAGKPVTFTSHKCREEKRCAELGGGMDIWSPIELISSCVLQAALKVT